VPYHIANTAADAELFDGSTRTTVSRSLKRYLEVVHSMPDDIEIRHVRPRFPNWPTWIILKDGIVIDECYSEATAKAIQHIKECPPTTGINPDARGF